MTAPARHAHLRSRGRIRPGAIVLLAFTMLAALFAPAWARADEPASGTSAAASASETQSPGLPVVMTGHGWATERYSIKQKILGEIKESHSTLVLHFPPRIGSVGSAADAYGYMRYAPEFEEAVEQSVSWRERVYFMLAMTQRGSDEPLRRVVSLRATRTILSGYEYDPPRPEELPPLIGDLEVVGFQATPIGPAAVVKPRVREKDKVISVGPVELRILNRGVWRQVALAPELADELDAQGPTRARRTLRVIAARDGLALWLRRPDNSGADLWTAIVGSAADSSLGPPDLVQWKHSERFFAGPNWPEGESRPRLEKLLFVQGATPANDALVGVRRINERLDLIVFRPSGPVPLATLSGIPAAAMIVGLGSPGPSGSAGGTVVVAWSEVVPGAKPDTLNPPKQFQVREVSVLTGREVYSGLAQSGLLISKSDFSLLAIMLILIMIAVMLFVLRAEPAAIPNLPADVEVADPIRRIGAMLADYIPGAILSAVAFGLPMFTLLSPTVVLSLNMPFLPLGAAMVAGAVHCTLGEWLTGRSLGKRLFGIEVINTGWDQQTRRRPAFWQALIRNLLRWMLPVLGVVALFDAARRHGGDLAARTVVVMPREEEPATKTPPDSE